MTTPGRPKEVRELPGEILVGLAAIGVLATAVLLWLAMWPPTTTTTTSENTLRGSTHPHLVTTKQNNRGRRDPT